MTRRIDSGTTGAPNSIGKIVSNNRGLSVIRVNRCDDRQSAHPDVPSLPDTKLQEQVRAYARASLAPNTRIAYQRAWQAFCTWCLEKGVPSLPAGPATISLYLAAKAPVLKVSTLSLALSAIRHAHSLAGENLDLTHPEVRSVFAGVRRTHGRAKRKALPLTVEILKSSLILLKSRFGNRNSRDAALLTIGFCAALRRSELVALRIRDVEFVTEGIIISLARRKSDQEGRGTRIGIPFGQTPETCPVTTLRAWLGIRNAASTDDWLFPAVRKSGKVGVEPVSGRDVARIVKATVRSLCLDASCYSAHSLRAGFVTSAAKCGIEEQNIMMQTGHKSVAIMRGYIREASLFQNNPLRKLNL